MNTVRRSVRRAVFALALALGLSATAPALGATAQAASPNLAVWPITLTTDHTDQWPTYYSTLTATSSVNVGLKQLDIDIYDQSTGARVAQCSTGYTCALGVTENVEESQTYIAYLTDATDVGGNHALSASAPVTIDWISVHLAFTVDKNTLPLGGTVTLTATTTVDIDLAPLYVQIWDVTTGAKVDTCAAGTLCQWTASKSVATTHAYVATFGAFYQSYPPPPQQETTPIEYVTWTDTGIKVALTGLAITHNPETITATANINVGSTPYYLVILNENNGAMIASCGVGSVCAISGYTPAASPGDHLVAFICNDPGALTLPAAGGVLASSNTLVTAHV
jgi:hypothetical protein